MLKRKQKNFLKRRICSNVSNSILHSIVYSYSSRRMSTLSSFKAPSALHSKPVPDAITIVTKANTNTFRNCHLCPYFVKFFFLCKYFNYCAPSCFNTTITVCSKIFRSKPKDQFSIYCTSSFTTSSKLVILLRPLTCQSPVIPGFILRRFL